MLQLEKQQKKLEAKGILVELGQLRTEWEAARNGGRGGNNLPIEEHEIDVVGDDSDAEDDAEMTTTPLTTAPMSLVNNNSTTTPTPPIPVSTTSPFLKLRHNFSIDNLLAVKSQTSSCIETLLAAKCDTNFIKQESLEPITKQEEHL